MSEHWTTIRDVAEVYDGPHATPKKIDEGPIFLGIASLNGGGLDLEKSAHVSEKDFAKWTRRIIPEVGDIVFSYETRLGEAAMIPNGVRCCLGRRMGLLRPKRDKVIPEYLLYAYLSPAFQSEIYSRTIHGSTVNRIALKELPEFPIEIPSLEIQREIVDILVSIDTKRSINERTNQTLEQIAQAIFKSWFVDFEPVKAKQHIRTLGGNDEQSERATQAVIAGAVNLDVITTATDLGALDRQLTQALGEKLAHQTEAQREQFAGTASHFPDQLVESELGLIPAGWEVLDIGETCNLARGGSPRPIRKFMGGTIPWVKIADATRAIGPHIFSTREFVKEDGVSKSVLLKPGALILSNSATCGIPKFLEIEGCIHDGWLYFDEFKIGGKFFLYFALQRLTTKLVQIADGSVQKNLNIGLVKGQRQPFPSEHIAVRFEHIVFDAFEAIRSNSLQSRSLVQLRDLILPKLLSGELAPNQSR